MNIWSSIPCEFLKSWLGSFWLSWCWAARGWYYGLDLEHDISSPASSEVNHSVAFFVGLICFALPFVVHTLRLETLKDFGSVATWDFEVPCCGSRVLHCVLFGARLSGSRVVLLMYRVVLGKWSTSQSLVCKVKKMGRLKGKWLKAGSLNTVQWKLWVSRSWGK